ncbi:CYFA0S08e02762g1_1 [Cyberlindnera fabianii]|uniref:CYFA0S08e02762g1_1 n=1 Tax=Cyberlindnera fabianii TaxID=36022 RepID=A0A061B324_CYBFA|nr:Calnexin [Cyberlindnera fabianii]CDR42027.1 CYFA0S08e02762g1_1 [Cyberlindnera fabianii]
MKFSKLTVPAALALLAKAEAETENNNPDFVPFDKSQLSSDSFFEQFDSDDWANLWKISKAKKDDEFSYVGKWSVEETKIFPGFKGDKGLVLKTKAAHHAIHAPLPQTFDNKDNTLVLQYEVKLQDGITCSGAYIKLLSAEGLPSGSEEYNNDTPYQVMFGPDKCGTTNKVHFIIKRKSPHTGEYEEKHLSAPMPARTVKTSTLYTLIIKPDNEFEVRIGGEVVKAGNLLDEGVFKPSFDPAAEIDDPEDVKPEDWDDREKIPDPEQATKPEDWDELAPYMIPDPEATKPDSWDETMPEYIPDPEAEKPEDWDDEEDGEWVAPTVFNPECEVHGCGPWEAPMIKNPDYKGKWVQPLIENPGYKGEWKPRKIANPAYYHDDHPSDLEPIGGIGFELWSMDGDILFDNIYLGHSVDEAELLGNATWKPKYDLEQEAVLNVTPKAKEADKAPVDIEDEDYDFFEAAEGYIKDFIADPLNTISSRPAEGALYAGASVGFAAIVLSILSFVLNAVTGAPATPAAPAGKKEEKIIEIEETEESTEATGVSVGETVAEKRS